MRRTGLAMLAVAAVAPGCAQLSVGLWADSDRGEKSVAAIAMIELPEEPAAARAAKPAVSLPAKFDAKKGDEWEVPAHSKATPTPAVGPKIPSAQAPAQKLSPEPVVEDSWGPTAKGVSKTAEFASEPKTYRWIQGRASFVKIGGSRVWKLRFAPHDQVDQYGGSFVLQGSLPEGLSEGDLVRAEGAPATEQPDSRASRYNCRRVTILQKANKSGP